MNKYTHAVIISALGIVMLVGVIAGALAGFVVGWGACGL